MSGEHAPAPVPGKRVIKRYPNRKLYDPHERAFTSLRAVERMIRRGIDVQVIDNATGEDITEDTLAQVLRAGHRGDADVLSAVIRAPGKIAQAIAGEQDNAAEIRELQEQVRQLAAIVDTLLHEREEAGAEEPAQSPSRRRKKPPSS
jgi:polyhydroxyalkanoate synthesis repressor PhaR